MLRSSQEPLKQTSVSNDVEDALSSRSDSVGQHHDPADEQRHKVRFHFLGPRPAIACFRLPLGQIRGIASPNLFSAPEMAWRRLPLLVRACFKSLATFGDIRSTAQKRGKRGNIAKAFAVKCTNFRDGGDGHS
jgi:hypothetical protein